MPYILLVYSDMEDLRQPREKGGLGLPSGLTCSLAAPFSLLFHFGKRKRRIYNIIKNKL